MTETACRRAGRGLGLIAIALVAAGVDAATTRQLTQFVVEVRAQDTWRFVVATDDSGVIERYRDDLARPAGERNLFPIGEVRAGHGGFNLGWSWHLDPDGLDLAEVAIELCDGTPQYVEDNLEDWIDQVGSYCPWGGRVVAEGGVGPPADPSLISVELEPVVSGFDQPVAIVAAGDGSGRLFVVEKPGRVIAVDDDQLGSPAFLDIRGRVGSAGSEQGLLGLAFAPDYATSGHLFVNYTDVNGDTVISRFTASGPDAGSVDASTETVLLEVDQPFGNHNGGHLVFGPDGMLWVGLGDGGAANDPLGAGQDGETLLGAMLRLDVTGGSGVTVPPDNPFVDDPEIRDEIWALGLRNPWRFSFDRRTGDLFIADVGQNRFEEVSMEGSRSPGGRNYGWNVMEGFECFAGAECDPADFATPAVVYGHDQGCSVTGGVVYRGERFPWIDGVYLFTDYCSGRLWALQPGGAGGWAVAEVGTHPGALVAFGEDERGEVWAVDLAAGQLLRLEASRQAPPPRRSDARRMP